LVILVHAACAAPGPRPAATASPPPKPGHAQATPSPAASPPGSTAPQPLGAADPLQPSETREREQALAAMDAGRYDEAEQAFARLLSRHPGNLELDALYHAARKAREGSQRRATLWFANLVPTPLEAPPWSYQVRAPAFAGAAGPPPQLRKLAESRNQITDDADWFRRNQLPPLATFRLGAASGTLAVDVAVGVADTPAGAAVGARVAVSLRALAQEGLPLALPAGFGTCALTLAIDRQDKLLLVYGASPDQGRYLAVIDRAHRTVDGFLDFDRYLTPPEFAPTEADFVRGEIQWADVRDGVLYVATGHRTYARSSRGKNAFLSALGLKTGRLLWRSDPLVANANNFLLRDGYIISGYGFTAEKDFLYVLERATGRTVARVPLKKSPSYLVEKNGKLFVRTYSYDYVFGL
jgi:hypothetical protein